MVAKHPNAHERLTGEFFLGRMECLSFAVFLGVGMLPSQAIVKDPPFVSPPQPLWEETWCFAHIPNR